MAKGTFRDLSPSLADRWVTAFPAVFAPSLRAFGWVTIRNLMVNALRIMCETDASVLGLIERSDVVKRRSAASWDKAQTDDNEAINCLSPELMSTICGSAEFGDLWERSCRTAINAHYHSLEYHALVGIAARTGAVQRTIFSSLCRAWYAGGQQGAASIGVVLSLTGRRLVTVSRDTFVTMVRGWRRYCTDTRKWTEDLMKLDVFDVDPRSPDFDMNEYGSEIKQFVNTTFMPLTSKVVDSGAGVYSTRRMLDINAGRTVRGELYKDTREITSRLEQVHVALGQTPYTILASVANSLSIIPYGLVGDDSGSTAYRKPAIFGCTVLRERVVQAFWKCVGDPASFGNIWSVRDTFREHGAATMDEMFELARKMAVANLAKAYRMSADQKQMALDFPSTLIGATNG